MDGRSVQAREAIRQRRVPGDRDGGERRAHGAGRAMRAGPAPAPAGRAAARVPLLLPAAPAPAAGDPRRGLVLPALGQRPGSEPSPATDGLDVAGDDQGRRLAGRGAIPVDIPARYALDGRGGWYVIRQGIRGLLAPDEAGHAVAYVVCEPASHYSRILQFPENPQSPTCVAWRVRSNSHCTRPQVIVKLPIVLSTALADGAVGPSLAQTIDPCLPAGFSATLRSM